MNHCVRHFEEQVAGVCRTCHQTFCTRCLVFSFGPKKPPFCLVCALHASGIRNGVRHVAPVMEAAPIPEGPSGAPASAAAMPALPGTLGDGAAPEPAQDRRFERARRRAEREAIKQAEKTARRAARRSEPVPVKATVPGDDLIRDTRVPAPSELASASSRATGTSHLD